MGWRKLMFNPKEIGLIKHFSKTMMDGNDWNKPRFIETSRSRHGDVNSRLVGVRKDRRLLYIEINHDTRLIEMQFGLLERLDKTKFPIYHLEKARKFSEDIVRDWKK